MVTKAQPVVAPDPLEAPTAPTMPAQSQRSPADVRRSAWWWIRLAAIAVTSYAGYQLLVVLGGVVQAFFRVVLFVVFGAILSFLLGPIVDVLHRHLRVPRTLAILATLFGVLGLLAGAIYLAAGPTVNEARGLAGQIPDLINRANGELDSLRSQLRSKGIDVSALDLGGSGSTVANRLSGILLTTVGGTVEAIIDIVIVFVVAFWILKDGENLRAGFLTLLPGRVRVHVEFALDATGVVIGGYVRAQIFLAFVIGALAGIGCAVIGVPFPIVVALAAGTFEMIPIVGPIVGGGVAILLALTRSFDLAFATLILFIGIHVIEGYVLAPRIQAKFVQLHPLVSLLALFAGIDIGGFIGALFAVPVASLAAVFIRAVVGDFRAARPELYATRRADLYRERRRETILGEFRLFKRSPWAMMRERIAGRPAAPVDSRPPIVGGVDASPSEVRLEEELRRADTSAPP